MHNTYIPKQYRLQIPTTLQPSFDGLNNLYVDKRNTLALKSILKRAEQGIKEIEDVNEESIFYENNKAFINQITDILERKDLVNP